MFFEHAHHPREVHERPTEAIDLVDDNAVDLACRDVGEEPLQRGTFHVPAGESAVVVALGNACPPLGLLARDERLSALALGIERVEVLVQPLFGALAGVDLGGRRIIKKKKNKNNVA